MRHSNSCNCVDCRAKGKPINCVYLSSITAEELANIEIFDWLEGYGQILSLASEKLVRKFGFLLIKQQNEIRKLESLISTMRG